MGDQAASSREDLQTRLRQQEAVARLGERALWGPPLQELFDLAAEYLRDSVEADLTKVLEWYPADHYVLLRSGTGWSPGSVGSATEPDRRGSAAGYALLTEAPLIVPDLATEQRFTPSDLLREHAAVSGLAVVIRGAYRPFGVLAAFTTAPRRFTQDDVHFLQALANVLAASIQRAESELRTRASEAQFREMVDGIPIMVWMHGATGEQELVNRTLCEYFGLPREEMTGERWASLLHPDDADAYTGEFLRSMEERRSFRAEARVKRADGLWRLIESRGEPRLSATGEFYGMVGASLDVTDQRAAEEALKDADRRKNEFIALLGHELRNPLTPIASAAAQLDLQRDGIDRQQLAHVAAVLSRQSNYLTRVINDLLDVSRIDRGTLTLQKEIIDLREVVDQAVEAIPQLGERGSFSLALDLPDETLAVCGDRVRLVQALTNILDNAVTHNAETGEIGLDAQRKADGIALRIRDEGVGIDPDVLPRLFEPFERGEQSQSAGLGLGLPLVRWVLEMHGGRVEAHSEGPGRGSTFVLHLPAVPAASGEPPQEKGEAARLEAAAPPTARAQDATAVLLVEDHDDVAQALQDLLEALEQSVDRVDSGQDAIERVREQRYALALIDVRLPDMTGFELASELRRLRDDMALVGLSGFPASNFAPETLQTLDDYLLKPPSPADLERIIGRAQQGER